MGAGRNRMHIEIKKGLNIPLSGAPEQAIQEARPVSRVALVAHEYPGLKPGMQVGEGDEVASGQVLFVHRRDQEICYTSPASGVVEKIYRGEKRVLQSVVIRVEGDRQVQFERWAEDEVATGDRGSVVAQLLTSGLWPAIKTRPYGKTPSPRSEPHSVFVNAMDTRPLAPDPAVVIEDAPRLFQMGMQVVGRLTSNRVFVCVKGGVSLPLPKGRFDVVEFSGPHPAGLAGTHVHFLDPVRAGKVVWVIGYQDVMAFGALFDQGVYPHERVISLAGPMVREPRLLRTCVGACVSELCASEIDAPRECRRIAGSALDGYKATGWSDFLGRFSLQITVLRERDSKRQVLGWLRPRFDLFSASRAVFSHLLKSRSFPLTCMQNGSPRALVPIDIYERVMPLDLLPAPLLRSLLVGDTDMAQGLGCLELEEEDLALCSYVCPGKHEFGEALRENLELIEREG